MFRIMSEDGDNGGGSSAGRAGTTSAGIGSVIVVLDGLIDNDANGGSDASNGSDYSFIPSTESTTFVLFSPVTGSRMSRGITLHFHKCRGGMGQM